MVLVCKRWQEAVYKTCSSLDLSPPRISSRVTDIFLNEISSRFPNVIDLNLSDCELITDNSLMYINRLSLLSLSLFNCHGITDDGIIQLSAQKDLQLINIGENPNISDKSVLVLMNKFPAIKIQCMFCGGISSELKIRLMKE